MKKADGFSLVEVVLALGIFIFCLVALMGLLTVGLKNGRGSSDNTAQTLMTSRMVSFIRDPANSASVTTGFTTNFTGEGELASVSGSNMLPAYYKCKIRSIAVSTSSDATDPDTTPSEEPDLTNIVLEFTWPVLSGGGASLNTNTINVTIPPYH